MQRPSIASCASLVVAATVLSCMLTGCQYRADAHGEPQDFLAADLIGQQCRVQFRRDYLGAAGDSPVSINTDAFNGHNMTLHGTVKNVNASWLVLETTDGTKWIPRDALLVLDVSPRAED